MSAAAVADYYAMSRAERIEAISEAMMWAEWWAESGRSDADTALSAAYSAIAANHIALLAVRDAAAVHGSSS